MATKSERTQQRIIDAANQLFYRKGYNRTSFTDVVDEAEVPRGNIYYYFKTKEEMLKAVIKHRMETTTLMLSEWEKSIKTPLDRLERFVQIMYDSTPALLRSGCPMGSLNVELAKDQPELKSDAKQLFDLFQQWLAKQFAQMGYPEEARELSLELLARGQGIIVIAQVYQDPGFLERGTKEINRWLENLDRYA
ncbi:TetR/AcrR family transcriptional regulator [Sedimenticola hydrogenitrophicus]|uniref:TetR/AcrR family transcriptional regulator n=1 Tax=Sedimenticola hydrogenitrophicus TaxID=2967975 RepID=UPI0023AF6E07|nr:TetR/AcrR family transcriptional regulator [Sedimenticola hydrogenitrophicus]